MHQEMLRRVEAFNAAAPSPWPPVCDA